MCSFHIIAYLIFVICLHQIQCLNMKVQRHLQQQLSQLRKETTQRSIQRERREDNSQPRYTVEQVTTHLSMLFFFLLFSLLCLLRLLSC